MQRSEMLTNTTRPLHATRQKMICELLPSRHVDLKLAVRTLEKDEAKLRKNDAPGCYARRIKVVLCPVTARSAGAAPLAALALRQPSEKTPPANLGRRLPLDGEARFSLIPFRYSPLPKGRS